MKKVSLAYIGMMTLLMLVLIGCGSEKDPLPITEPYIDIQNISTKTFDLADSANAALSFDIELIDFDQYDVDYISLNVAFNEFNYFTYSYEDEYQRYDSIEFLKIEEYPTKVEIFFRDLMAIPEFETTDFLHNDKFEFFFTIRLADGNVIIPELTSSVCEEPSQPVIQKCSFFVDVSCHFSLDEALGEWHVVYDAFDYFVDDVESFKVITGPGENQVTFVNIFNHINPETGERDYDVIVDVNPLNGAVNIEYQDAWHCDNWGCVWGVGTIFGRGTIFNCLDRMELLLYPGCAACSFGNYPLIMEKR